MRVTNLRRKDGKGFELGENCQIVICNKSDISTNLYNVSEIDFDVVAPEYHVSAEFVRELMVKQKINEGIYDILNSLYLHAYADGTCQETTFKEKRIEEAMAGLAVVTPKGETK